MNRLTVRAGSVLLGGCAALVVASPACARPLSTDLWFAGARLVFDHAQPRDGDVAVSADDDGLRRFLGRLGATAAYAPGQRYVVVTTADRRTVIFTLGDARYNDGTSSATAAFRPFVFRGEAYLPFFALARALDVQPLAQGRQTVLEPQIGALNVRTQGTTTYVTLRSGLPLGWRRTTPNGAPEIRVAFPGVASSLEHARAIGAAGLESVAVDVAGSPRDPETTLTFRTPRRGVQTVLTAPFANETVFAFGPRGERLAGTPLPRDAAPMLAAQAAPSRPRPAAPVAADVDPLGTEAGTDATHAPNVGAPGLAAAPDPASVPAASRFPAASGIAGVSDVTAAATADGATVRIAVAGDASYEWHRLPDDRWYVDLKGATLTGPGREMRVGGSALDVVRYKQFATGAAPVVRVALVLHGSRRVDVATAPSGLSLNVSSRLDGGERVGFGAIGAAVPATAPATAVAAVPSPGTDPMLGAAAGAPEDPAAPEGAPLDPPWKYAGAGVQPVVGRGRLIVLDPGHGGSDSGAEHNGLTEKVLTLDIAQRLRPMLVARGFAVKMTRDRDVDVFAPNDSAHDELQARCDAGNSAAAAMFVSIHINSSTSSAPNGTTTFFYKPQDYALAAAIERRLVPALGTANDGVQKANFYVMRHTTMPATLIETAFLSNVSDAALLRLPQFRQRVATAIADGIGDYAMHPEATSRADVGATDAQ